MNDLRGMLRCTPLTHTVRQQTGGVLRAEEVAAGGAEEGQILVLDDDLN